MTEPGKVSVKDGVYFLTDDGEFCFAYRDPDGIDWENATEVDFFSIDGKVADEAREARGKLQMSSQEGTVTVTTRCPECRKTAGHEVSWAGLEARKAGAKIQDAFPNMAQEEREQFVTGICPACWDTMFSGEGG